MRLAWFEKSGYAKVDQEKLPILLYHHIGRFEVTKDNRRLLAVQYGLHPGVQPGPGDGAAREISRDQENIGIGPRPRGVGDVEAALVRTEGAQGVIDGHGDARPDPRAA